MEDVRPANLTGGFLYFTATFPYLTEAITKVLDSSLMLLRSVREQMDMLTSIMYSVHMYTFPEHKFVLLFALDTISFFCSEMLLEDAERF